MHAVVNDERARWRGRRRGRGRVRLRCGDAVYDSYSVAKRRAVSLWSPSTSCRWSSGRFSALLRACCVDVMATGNFDAEPGADLLLLSTVNEAAVLDLDTYAVKARFPFASEKCDRCVGMSLPEFGGGWKGQFPLWPAYATAWLTAGGGDCCGPTRWRILACRADRFRAERIGLRRVQQPGRDQLA